jgi:hypothetical protein
MAMLRIVKTAHTKYSSRATETKASAKYMFAGKFGGGGDLKLKAKMVHIKTCNGASETMTVQIESSNEVQINQSKCNFHFTRQLWRRRASS